MASEKKGKGMKGPRPTVAQVKELAAAAEGFAEAAALDSPIKNVVVLAAAKRLAQAVNPAASAPLPLGPDRLTVVGWPLGVMHAILTIRKHLDNVLALPGGQDVPCAPGWRARGGFLAAVNRATLFPADLDVPAGDAEAIRRAAGVLAKQVEEAPVVEARPQAGPPTAVVRVQKEAVVLGLLAKNPGWTDGQIADAAEVSRTSLYRMKRFVDARRIVKEGGRKGIPKRKYVPDRDGEGGRNDAADGQDREDADGRPLDR